MVTMMPLQAAALTRLLSDTNAVACEIASDERWGLRVATYHPSPIEAGPPAEARWYTISVAGTVCEVAPVPVAEAA